MRGWCCGAPRESLPAVQGDGGRGHGQPRDTLVRVPTGPAAHKAVWSCLWLANPAQQRGRAPLCAGCVYLKYLILPNAPQLIWGLRSHGDFNCLHFPRIPYGCRGGRWESFLCLEDVRWQRIECQRKTRGFWRTVEFSLIVNAICW